MKTSLITIFLAATCMLTFQALGQNCQKTKCNHSHHMAPKSGLTDNMRSDTIDVLNYDITLDFAQASIQEITGRCKIKFEVLQSNVHTISLDLLQLTVDSIKQGALTSTFSYNDTLLIVNLGLPLLIGAIDSVEVYYHGHPQGDPSNWGGFYFQGNYSYNLGVGFGANPHNYGRVWHPCFDNFVERATYDIELKSPLGLKGYANGLMQNETIGSTNVARKWKLTQEIPTYLACVAVSNYTHVNQTYISNLNTNSIPVQLIAASNDTTSLKNSFANLFGAMDAFESQYGPYLWDKVGFHLVPFSSGAMEHATSIAYPQATANGTLTYETLMAHELSHHWWGNLVTCRTAEDMWINEGMASYSERIFLEGVYGYDRYISDIRNNHKDVLYNAHIRDSGYYALHGVPHSITYGDHSYNKGADVAHTLRSYMGDGAFFSGLQSFLADNVFSDVDAFDFRDHLNSNTTIDVTNFFNDWVLSPGFPAFIIDSTQIVSNGGGFDAEIYIQQKTKGTTNLFTDVPLEITFVDANWNKHMTTLIATGAQTQVSLTIPFYPIMSYLNGGDKISQAVTGDEVIMKGTGTKDLSYSLFRYTVLNNPDSSLIRTEHYWVAPDEFKEPLNVWSYHLSSERFWKVDGVFGNGFSANGRLFFNGRTNINANLDNQLFAEPGFHEDSIKLLFRENSANEWIEVPGITISNLGSKTDGYGFVQFDTLKKGEYTFGWRKSPLAIDKVTNPKISLKPYPNPTSDWLNLGGDLAFNQESKIVVTDQLGRVVIEQPYLVNQLNVSNLSKGIYTVSIHKNGTIIVSAAFTKE